MKQETKETSIFVRFLVYVTGFLIMTREHPKDCVNLQTDVRYNYSVWRFLKWPEKKIRHKKQ